MRDLIEKGVVDAVTSPWGSVTLFGIDKVTKYHLDIPLATTTFQWIMNPKIYDSMSPAQKKVIDDHCTTDWAVKIRRPMGGFRGRRHQQDKEQCRRMRSSRSARSNWREWKASGEPLFKQWADDVRKVGGDPDAIMKDLKHSARSGQGVILTQIPERRNE